MSLTKKMTDKKVNFEFNKEFISVFSKKIKDSNTEFLNNTLKELHPADSADIIENLVPEDRSRLIELEGFSLDPEIFIELNEFIFEDVPLKKWTHIVLVVDQKTVSLYINGKLSIVNELEGLPKIANGDLLITRNGGFDGLISSIRFS